MEKSTSTATQIAESPPPATSSLPDQRAELPSLAMDLDNSPAFTPGASQTLPSPSPSPTAAAQPQLAAQVPTPPSIATTDPSSRGRKRALEGNLQIENSNYYKMRLLLKDLRPHVLEVLRTPDFRNCQAAIEIQQKMKLMLQLYQEMIGDTPTKREKTTKSESLSNGKAIDQTPQSTTTEMRSSETISVQTEKHNSDDGDGDKVKAGDTVVGGSAFGWNFITYGGAAEAVYCGVSKEEYRSSHPIIQLQAEVESHSTL